MLLFAVASFTSAKSEPQPLELPAAVPAPHDQPFAGTIRLNVDATDTRHRIFSVHETIPVTRLGEVTLLYPQWETTSHATTTSVANLAGLEIHGSGQRLRWHRDPVNVYAFHVDVPTGVSELEITFQYLSAIGPRARPVVMTSAIINVQWQYLLLYPAGWFARNLSVASSLKLPRGFEAATSLRTTRAADSQLTFNAVDLETLVDSPVYAGVHTLAVDLSADPQRPITAHLFADKKAQLLFPDSERDLLRATIAQTMQLFGPPHFDRFDFLISLSDRFPSDGGLEHMRSSEINLSAAYFTTEQRSISSADLIAHEFVHAWNGKFRQPADSGAPNFNEPMRNSLLWVYEGQTEFWGRVLAARSGQRSLQDTLDVIAIDAATVATRAGRRWKSLQESTHDALYMAARPVPWRDWQRREDYYTEGVLLWLDVDGIMRERSDGKKSLNDFARSFFDIAPGSAATVTYTFDELCRALADIVPFNWEQYFRSRLDTNSDAGVLDGLERAGYRLVYAPTPTAAFHELETESGVADFTYSLGLAVTKDGIVKTLAWKSPAFDAGLTIDARLLTINDRPFSVTELQHAIAESEQTPLELTFEIDGETERARVNYRGSLRYPRLERIPEKPDSLAALFRALSTPPTPSPR